MRCYILIAKNVEHDKSNADKGISDVDFRLAVALYPVPILHDGEVYDTPAQQQYYKSDQYHESTGSTKRCRVLYLRLMPLHLYGRPYQKVTCYSCSNDCHE